MKVERFVGANLNQQEKKNAQDYYRRRFEGSNFSVLATEMIKKERQKTPEEVLAISLANDVVGEFVSQYGISAIKIPENNHHFLNEEDWSFDGVGAFYDQNEQHIFYCHNSSISKMFVTIIHEMIHFNSYQAVWVDRNKIDENTINIRFSNYRVGWDTMSLKEKNKTLFTEFNEGLTEHIVKFLWQKVFNNPIFSKELKETNLCKNDLEKIDALRYIVNNSDFYRISKTPGKEKSWDVSGFNFIDNRRAISLLVDKICIKIPDLDNNEVFQIMIRGIFNGNMLSFARIIKKCFGAKAIRQIGEANSGTNLLEVVEKLN